MSFADDVLYVHLKTIYIFCVYELCFSVHTHSYHTTLTTLLWSGTSSVKSLKHHGHPIRSSRLEMIMNRNERLSEWRQAGKTWSELIGIIQLKEFLWSPPSWSSASLTAAVTMNLAHVLLHHHLQSMAHGKLAVGGARPPECHASYQPSRILWLPLMERYHVEVMWRSLWMSTRCPPGRNVHMWDRCRNSVTMMSRWCHDDVTMMSCSVEKKPLRTGKAKPRGHTPRAENTHTEHRDGRK